MMTKGCPGEFFGVTGLLYILWWWVPESIPCVKILRTEHCKRKQNKTKKSILTNNSFNKDFSITLVAGIIFPLDSAG